MLQLDAVLQKIHSVIYSSRVFKRYVSQSRPCPDAARIQLNKEGKNVLLVNAPRGYRTTLGALPAGAKVVRKADGLVDVLQLFIANRQEMEAELPKVKALAGPQSLIWVTYLKGTARTKTDINRDSLHAYARTVGLEGVSLVSINDDWSAMRFKLV